MKIFVPGGGSRIIPPLRELPDVDEVIVSQIHPWAYGNFAAHRSYRLPRFDDPAFLDRFEEIFHRDPFDVCLPVHDMALLVFSRNRRRIESLPFRLAINPEPTIELVADKMALHDFFHTCGLPTPATRTLEAFALSRDLGMPCFVKPRFIDMRDSPAELYMKVEDEVDLEYALQKVRGAESRYVIQEFVEGTEVNIDFFCDADGAVRSVVPLKRLGMGANRAIGRGEILFDDRFGDHVAMVAKHARFWGPCQLQGYLVGDGEELRFTEINARLSGSSIFVKEAGVNYFAHLLSLLRSEPVEIREKPRPLLMSIREAPFFYSESPIRE